MTKSDELMPKFVTLMLWMNSGCNARCITCEIWKQKIGSFHSASEIDSWAPSWYAAGVRLIELCGEPTIHPEFAEVCLILKRNKLKFSVLSNGLRLGSFTQLIIDFAESLTVSLDGPPPIHDKVRGVPGAFRKLSDNIRGLRKISPAFPIYGRCAVHRLNYRSVPETVDVAKNLELTAISFLALDTETLAFGREKLSDTEWKGQTRSLALAQEDTHLLDSILNALAESHAGDFDVGFIRESIAELRKVLLPSLHPTSESGIRCNIPFRSAVIEPDGAVKPCWFLPAYGSLRDSVSLSALLSSLEARRFFSTFDVAREPACQSCVCPRVFRDDGKSISGRATR